MSTPAADKVLYHRQRAAALCTQCGRPASMFYACCQRCRDHNASRKAWQRLDAKVAKIEALRAQGLVTLREYAKLRGISERAARARVGRGTLAVRARAYGLRWVAP